MRATRSFERRCPAPSRKALQLWPERFQLNPILAHETLVETLHRWTDNHHRTSFFSQNGNNCFCIALAVSFSFLYVSYSLSIWSFYLDGSLILDFLLCKKNTNASERLTSLLSSLTRLREEQRTVLSKRRTDENKCACVWPACVSCVRACIACIVACKVF